MLTEHYNFSGGLNTVTSPELLGANTAVEVANIQSRRGNLTPHFDVDLLTDTAIGKYNYMFKGNVFSSAGRRNYVTFASKLYYTDESQSFGLYRGLDDGSSVNAVAPKLNTPSVLSATFLGVGNLHGEYNYVYTVVDNQGIESASSLPIKVNVVDNSIDITITPPASNESSEPISYRRLYRMGGNNPTFNLVAELDVTVLTYNDNVADIDISRIELTVFKDSTPPSKLTNLTELNGTLWASVDDRIYFSATGRPEHWGTNDYVVLSDVVTGIKAFSDNMILAFTKDESYVITGYNRDNVSVRPLDKSIGCQNIDSIVNIKGMILWAGINNIYAYNGGRIINLTEKFQTAKSETIKSNTFGSIKGTFGSNSAFNIGQAVALDGRYYIEFQGTIGSIDLENNGSMEVIDIGKKIDGLYTDSENNIMRMVVGTELYSFGDSGNLTAVWRTGYLNQGEFVDNKTYRKIEFSDTVDMCEVWIDNKKTLPAMVKKNTKSFFLPSNKNRGKWIQLKIYSKNVIDGYTISYSKSGKRG